MEKQKKELVYQAIGLGMFVYLFAVINFVDLRFVEYFSCFSFALIALGLMLRLKNKFLNLFTVSYLIVCVYLLARQAIWVGEHGIDANFTYQDPSMQAFPWWIHVVMHGLPIPIVFLVIAERRPAVDWKIFSVIVLLLVAWSYTMDAERFLGIPDFFIAYPLGIPLTVAWLLVYEKIILPRLPGN